MSITTTAVTVTQCAKWLYLLKGSITAPRWKNPYTNTAGTTVFAGKKVLLIGDAIGQMEDIVMRGKDGYVNGECADLYVTPMDVFIDV